MKRFDFRWDFPLPRVHTGLLLGNGRTGLMIWGGDRVLNITVGRGDWWDHRGGKDWTAAMNWPDIRRFLEAGDEAGLHAMFGKGKVEDSILPTIVPVGRFELHLPAGSRLVAGRLDRFAATVSIDVELRGETHTVDVELCMDRSLARVALPGPLVDAEVRARPAYDTAGDALAKRGVNVPEMIRTDRAAGFTQTLPDDLAMTAVAVRRDDAVWIATGFEGGEPLLAAIGSAGEADFAVSRKWWRDYWSRTPRISVPNERVQFLFDYGAYKFAGLTCPFGAAAGLQGAWIEDNRTPPWSGDYHFNINVQMCYSPAYACNHLAHLRPLFDMIQGWMPQLRDHARKFLGIDDGVMLPHAVDDRCKIIGTFWTGTIDHGCTAWVGKMMYDYWSFGGGDDAWAREVMVPFLLGAMRVYEGMLDRDGDALVLPVSVSPEYRGAAIDAWGRNASFQLACIHLLCEKLIALSEQFAFAERPIWREVLAKLPRACVQSQYGNDRIFLWQDTPLAESHRHHSHLAGIAPFDVIDPADPAWREIVRHSINHWIAMGMGHWTGWCMPWAVQLHARVGNADMAELMLEIWQRVFTNRGHGTLHDHGMPGLTLMGSAAGAATFETMQMDAGMGALAAIADMLCHTQRGVARFFRGCPDDWDHVSFAGIRVEGGFLVDGERRSGGAAKLVVRATRDGQFRYVDPVASVERAIDMRAGGTAEIG